MTMITFNNDDERANFVIGMTLTALRNEVKYGLLTCDPRKGTTVRTLARYFTGLKKTRKGAYKQLVEAGIYTLLDADRKKAQIETPQLGRPLLTATLMRSETKREEIKWKQILT